MDDDVEPSQTGELAPYVVLDEVVVSCVGQADCSNGLMLSKNQTGDKSTEVAIAVEAERIIGEGDQRSFVVDI